MDRIIEPYWMVFDSVALERNAADSEGRSQEISFFATPQMAVEASKIIPNGEVHGPVRMTIHEDGGMTLEELFSRKPH